MGSTLEAETLADIRREIDAVDTELFALLEHRYGLTARIARIKRDPLRIEDENRNREILARIGRMAERASMDREDMQAIWVAILRASIARQKALLARPPRSVRSG